MFSVFNDEKYMMDTINEALVQVSINKGGPRSFISSYEEYYYILNGQAKQELLTFFAQEPPPFLKVHISIKSLNCFFF